MQGYQLFWGVLLFQVSQIFSAFCFPGQLCYLPWQVPCGEEMLSDMFQSPSEPKSTVTMQSSAAASGKVRVLQLAKE